MVWISGGVYGLMLLATVYCGESIRVAWRGGMEAVVELPEWAEVLERNPRNRDRFLALDPARVHRDARALDARVLPRPRRDGARACTTRRARASTVPTLIFRSGARDPHHTRATSERLHELIPGSRLVEPPWGDDEWNERSDAAREGAGALFERWPLLAPQLLELSAR